MTTVRETFVAAQRFPLDEFQRRALDSLDADRSVLVAAPTGSGKTVVAEYAVVLALARGGKVFYTTPIKALSNQKFRDLTDILGTTNVGLLTGDNSIRGEAPVVVMTTEVLRNMIYAASPTLTGLTTVVLDEVHYLGDRERGSVWEEVIIHLPPEVRLVCLSATVANADELAEWLATVRGETDAIVETRRPVELEQHYAVGERHRDELQVVPMFVDGRPNRDGFRFDHRHPARRRGRFVPPPRVELVEALADEQMLPAIFFIFSRDGCDAAVARSRSFIGRLTTDDERERIRAIAEAHTEGLSDDDLRLLGYGTWLDALEVGLAAHHAGMVPPMKEAVEEAFTAGLVKVVFATETLALGVNMPARTVVIERLTKFTGERHEMLTPGEYTQLTGRAGRRGIDDRGYAVVCWSPWTPFGDVASLAASPPSPLTSSFRPTYNTAANLVRRYDPEEAHRLLNLSFAQFHADRDTVSLERELERRRARLDTLRRGGGTPETEGRAAKLETVVNRLERRIRRRSGTLGRQFDRVLQILVAWGYVDDWSLTDRGQLLARLYAEADLLVAEAVQTGILDELDPADVAAVVSTLTFQSRGRDDGSEHPGVTVAERIQALEKLWSSLAAIEHDSGVPETRVPDRGFADAARRWIAGEHLDQILDETLAPGDFVRSIKQCIDLLHQLADVAPRPVATRAATAAQRARRGLVEASSAVGA